MAVTLSSFFCSFFPSKSTTPSTSCQLSTPSHVHLRKTSYGFSSLVATKNPTASPPSFSSLYENIGDISAIMNPAFACSTILYSKGGYYNVEIIVGENEPEDKLINRFKREVFKAGVIQECKRRRFFENNHDKRKRKAKEAARRNSRRSGIFFLHYTEL